MTGLEQGLEHGEGLDELGPEPEIFALFRHFEHDRRCPELLSQIHCEKSPQPPSQPLQLENPPSDISVLVRAIGSSMATELRPQTVSSGLQAHVWMPPWTPQQVEA